MARAHSDVRHRSIASRRLSGSGPTASASADARRERLGARLDALEAGRHHRRQHQVRVAVGARDPVLDVARPAVAADAERRRPALRAVVERGRHEVGRVEPLVRVHVRAGEQHELGRAAHDAADEVPAELATGRSPSGSNRFSPSGPASDRWTWPDEPIPAGSSRAMNVAACPCCAATSRVNSFAIAARSAAARAAVGSERDLALAVAHLRLHRLDRDAARDERAPQVAEQTPRRGRRGRSCSRSASGAAARGCGSPAPGRPRTNPGRRRTRTRPRRTASARRPRRARTARAARCAARSRRAAPSTTTGRPARSRRGRGGRRGGASTGRGCRRYPPSRSARRSRGSPR